MNEKYENAWLHGKPEVFNVIKNDNREKNRKHNSSLELRKQILKHVQSDGINLVQKIFDLGYFSLDDDTADENSKSLIFFSHVSSPNRGCITMKQLIEQIKHYLYSLSSCEPTHMSTLAYQCSVDILHIENALEQISIEDESKICYINIKDHEYMKIGNTIFPSLYLDKLMCILNAKLNSSYSSSATPLSNPGRISLSDVSLHLFHLPLDVTKQIILKRLTMLKGLIILDKDRQDVISHEYEHNIRRQIHGVFRACCIPVSLNVLQTQYKWPSKFLTLSKDSSSSTNPSSVNMSNNENISITQAVTLSQYVFEMCASQNKNENKASNDTSLPSLPGVFNLSNEIYTPFLFKLQQRQAVISLFQSSGYISESQAQKLGINSCGSEFELLEYICNLYEETNSVMTKKCITALPNTSFSTSNEVEYVTDKNRCNTSSNDDTNINKVQNILKLPISNVVFNADFILSSLLGIIYEAESNNLFVDFKMHLPDDVFLSECYNKQDIQFIVDYCLQAVTGDTSKSGKGAIIIAYGEVLYISSGMVNDLNETILPPLIDQYATTRANQIYDNLDSFTLKSSLSSEHEIMGEKIYSRKEEERKKPNLIKNYEPSSKLSTATSSMKKTSAKEKRRISSKVSGAANKNKKSTHNKNLESDKLESGVVPLTTIALAISKSYPNLSEIQSSMHDFDELEDDINSGNDAGIHENEMNFENLNIKGNKLILFAVAKGVIDFSRLNDLCTKAIQIKYQKLQKSKLSLMKTSTRSRLLNGDIAKSIEDSFENLRCFPNACYLIQMVGKSASSLKDSITVVQMNDQAELSLSINDTLVRCASYFAWRITEFSMFKHNVDTKKIVFINLDTKNQNTDKDDQELLEDESLLFYEPIDMGLITFPKMYLSCDDSNSKASEKNVLLLLRDVLPKEIGAAISNMWFLCGKQCYQGGEIESKDRFLHDNTESFAKFLRHVEDFCL